MEEKKTSLFEVMEGLTGIKKSEQVKMLQEIHENRERLDKCTLHDFSIEVPKHYKNFPSYKCTNCGGVVEYSEKKWYELGIAHAQQMGGTHENGK